MSLTQQALASKPVGFWMGDDSSPLQDYSGYGRSATISGTPPTHAPIAKGAAYAPVLSRANIATIPSAPIFKQGDEDRSFSLSAVLKTINRTEGYVAQTYRENLATNPSGEQSVAWSSNNGTQYPTTVDNTGISLFGSKSIRGTAATVQSAVLSSYNAGMTTGGPKFPVIPGETYTQSVYIRAAQAGYVTFMTFILYNTDGSLHSSPKGVEINATQNTWVRPSQTVTIPEGVTTMYTMVQVNKPAGQNAAIGDYANADGFLLEKTDTLKPYFDGSMPGHEWTGTADASISRTKAGLSNKHNLIYDPHMDGANTQQNAIDNIVMSDTAPLSGITNSTVATGVSWDNTTWTRVTNTSATESSNTRKMVALTSLQNNRNYVVSMEVANDTASAVTVGLDWCDTGNNNWTINPGQRRRVWVTGSRATYDTTYRFFDIGIFSFSTSILVRNMQVELGVTPSAYFDNTTTGATRNLAHGKPVSNNGGGYNEYSPITDNRTDPTIGTSSFGFVDQPGTPGTPKHVTVDLGSKVLLDRIKVWHFWADGRTYNSTRTQVSPDGTAWFDVFNSATAGTYAETSAGKTHNFSRQYVRYIRDWADGSTANTSSHWSEIEAYDTASELLYQTATPGTIYRSYTNKPAFWSYGIGATNSWAVKMTLSGETFTRFFVPGNQQSAAWRVIQGSMFPASISPGDEVTFRFRARTDGAWKNGKLMDVTVLQGNGLLGIGGTRPSFTLNSNWQEIAVTVTAVNNPSPSAQFYLSVPSEQVTEDTWVDIEYAMVTVNNESGPYFDSNSFGTVSNGTQYNSASTMLASNAEQQIIGHSGQPDGLAIDGSILSFGTTYTSTGSARCSYDIGDRKIVDVVGVHTKEKNSLYVDGVLVADVDISEAQQLDTFASSSTDLLIGGSDSSQAVAVNGIGLYPSALSKEDIANLHNIRFINDAEEVVTTFGGDYIPVGQTESNIFVSETWDSSEDWALGEMLNVGIDEDALVPQFSGTTSLAGRWQMALSLNAANTTSIHGVYLEYEGQGVSFETSLDGTNWLPANNHELVPSISSGYNPTGKQLFVRAVFAGGIANDTSYLESLTLTGIESTVAPSVYGRTVTYDNTTPHPQFELEHMSDYSGADIKSGGSLVLSADTVESLPARTIEMWVRATNSTQPTINVAGTTYHNGALATGNLAAGQWTLLHLVATADVTTSITITGPVQVGYIGIYETALSSTEIGLVFNAHVANNSQRVSDSSVLAITEAGNQATIYAHDWTIQGAG